MEDDDRDVPWWWPLWPLWLGVPIIIVAALIGNWIHGSG